MLNRKKLIFIFLFIVGILSTLIFAQAFFYINIFNNDLITENITFNQQGFFTRYINLSFDDYVHNAHIDLNGHNITVALNQTCPDCFNNTYRPKSNEGFALSYNSKDNDYIMSYTNYSMDEYSANEYNQVIIRINNSFQRIDERVFKDADIRLFDHSSFLDNSGNLWRTYRTFMGVTMTVKSYTGFGGAESNSWTTTAGCSEDLSRSTYNSLDNRFFSYGYSLSSTGCPSGGYNYVIARKDFANPLKIVDYCIIPGLIGGGLSFDDTQNKTYYTHISNDETNITIYELGFVVNSTCTLTSVYENVSTLQNKYTGNYNAYYPSAIYNNNTQQHMFICINGTIYPGFSAYPMFVILNTSLPRDVTIDVGDDSIVEQTISGSINTLQDNQDINASAFNDWLRDNCVSGQCNLPINFTSSSHGILEYLDLNITINDRPLLSNNISDYNISHTESLSIQTTCTDADNSSLLYYINDSMVSIDNNGLITDNPAWNENGTYYIIVTCGDGYVNSTAIVETGLDTSPDNYTCDGTFGSSYPCSNSQDGDWSTYASNGNVFGGTSYIIENYTIPNGALEATLNFSYYAPAGTGNDFYVNYFSEIDNTFILLKSAVPDGYTNYSVTLPNNATSGDYLVLNYSVINSATGYSASFVESMLNWTISPYSFKYTIRNERPTITPISNINNSHNESLNLQTICTDADNSSLLYYDNTTLFDINSTGYIFDDPLLNENGTYNIQIICGDGVSNTTEDFTYIIRNERPTVTPSISPSPAIATDNLNCTWKSGFSDVDNDTMTDIEYYWYNGGILQTLPTNTQLLDANNISENEKWSCSVNITAGGLVTGVSSSNNVTIGDTTAPSITNFAPNLSISYYTDTNVYLIVDCTDSGSGIDKVIATYTKDSGVSFINITNFAHKGGNSYEGYIQNPLTNLATYNITNWFCIDDSSNTNRTETPAYNLTFTTSTRPTGNGGSPGGGGGGSSEPVNISGAIEEALLAVTCGNGICDKNENIFNCPNDCKFNLDTVICFDVDDPNCIATQFLFTNILFYFLMIIGLVYVYRTQFKNKRGRKKRKDLKG